MTKLVCLGFVLGMLGGCGALDGAKTESKGDVPGEVVFSGYVQRAFTLKVNGKSFNDSEHFYTRFIQDLILSNPEYKAAFKGAKVEVEGSYGLQEFGANVGVLEWYRLSGHRIRGSQSPERFCNHVHEKTVFG